MACRPPLLSHVRFLANPPDLPIRQADDPGGPEYVAKARVTAEHERGLSLTGTTQTGAVLRMGINIIAPGVAHVLLEGDSPDPHRVTLARDLSDQAVNVSLEKSHSRVTLVSDLVKVQIGLDPFHITFYGPDGRVILDQNYTESDVTDRLTVLPFGFSMVEGRRVAFHDTFTAEPDEHFYGFGEKFTDLDKRGQRLEMWHYDAYGAHSERAYKNVPFFVSTRAYGIFLDSTTFINFDMAASNHSAFTLVVPDSALDYYVIVGPGLKNIITRYASLVSFPSCRQNGPLVCGCLLVSYTIVPRRCTTALVNCGSMMCPVTCCIWIAIGNASVAGRRCSGMRRCSPTRRA